MHHNAGVQAPLNHAPRCAALTRRRYLRPDGQWRGFCAVIMRMKHLCGFLDTADPEFLGVGVAARSPLPLPRVSQLLLHLFIQVNPMKTKKPVKKAARCICGDDVQSIFPAAHLADCPMHGFGACPVCRVFQSAPRAAPLAGDSSPSAASRPTAPERIECVKDSTGDGFTPGEWRVGDAGFTVFGPTTGAPSPETVARCRKRENAALISAAPELLAVVQELLLAPNKTRPERIWERARAAVAKATKRIG